MLGFALWTDSLQANRYSSCIRECLNLRATREAPKRLELLAVLRQRRKPSDCRSSIRRPGTYGQVAFASQSRFYFERHSTEAPPKPLSERSAHMQWVQPSLRFPASSSNRKAGRFASRHCVLPSGAGSSATRSRNHRVLFAAANAVPAQNSSALLHPWRGAPSTLSMLSSSLSPDLGRRARIRQATALDRDNRSREQSLRRREECQGHLRRRIRGEQVQPRQSARPDSLCPV